MDDRDLQVSEIRYNKTSDMCDVTFTYCDT
jgi:hypothetical protein